MSPKSPAFIKTRMPRGCWDGAEPRPACMWSLVHRSLPASGSPSVGRSVVPPGPMIHRQPWKDFTGSGCSISMTVRPKHQVHRKNQRHEAKGIRQNPYQANGIYLPLRAWSHEGAGKKAIAAQRDGVFTGGRRAGVFVLLSCGDDLIRTFFYPSDERPVGGNGAINHR